MAFCGFRPDGSITTPDTARTAGARGPPVGAGFRRAISQGGYRDRRERPRLRAPGQALVRRHLRDTPPRFLPCTGTLVGRASGATLWATSWRSRVHRAERGGTDREHWSGIHGTRYRGSGHARTFGTGTPPR